MSPSNIAVIGTGYVGLTTGACFAHLGHRVVCADIDAEKVERLSRGDIPILEAGLDEVVRSGLLGGRLSFVLGAAAAVADADFVYLCVPTPQGPDGSADLSYIRAAAAEIGPLLRPDTIVVNKSTVPVGSTRVVEEVLGRDDVSVVSNPEFLREGSAVHDFLHPDRIVVGAEDQAAAGRVAGLFESVGAPVIVTDPASAETIKYASNAFLAAKISFVNAVANVCEGVGADVRDVLLGMGYDRRIGFEFMKPGPGFGGSCFLGDETVLTRRGPCTRLMSFRQLFAEVQRTGPDGWDVLSWRSGEPTPEFLPAALFTGRPYSGDVITVHTKMGRRVTVTADHPFYVCDGIDATRVSRRLANELTTDDWLPLAQESPLLPEPASELRLADVATRAGIAERDIMASLDEQRLSHLDANRAVLSPRRVQEIRRCRTMRLNELRSCGLSEAGSMLRTTSNGTSVPAALPVDEKFWRIVGLYLAEGWITSDGPRSRIYWALHPTAEAHLVDALTDYWRGVGVKTTVRLGATAMNVSVSSRILAALFEQELALGGNCYEKRLPDAIWEAPPGHKRAVLRGLWEGDGSWSLVGGGPGVVLEYGTVSRELADGMLRLLGDLAVVARLKVGRTAKSSGDTYWLTISGADQVLRCLWLFPPEEGDEIGRSVSTQAKVIRPTGYRRLSKNAAWARVRKLEASPYEGWVYSLKVPDSGTVVTTHGLVVGQCFPKDTSALIRIAEDAGYDFGLLRGVNQVNKEQFERVTAKIEVMAGGSVEGLTIGAWGLTFKARTDDLRMSPALEVLSRLVERGAKVRAYDPAVSRPLAQAGLDRVEVCADPYAACESASVLTVLTEWDEFRRLDFGKVAGLMESPRLVDARNLLDPAALRRRGFEYQGIGR